MKKREISPEQITELEAFAKTVKNKAFYRRLQCVLLRAKNGFNREEIAQATGYNCRHVEGIQSEYFERGLMAFERTPRAKAGNQYQSPLEEAEFLYSLEPEAQAGRIIGAKTVQAKLAEHLQKPVSLSGVYGLLSRHDWTPKRPRPKHPQGDEEAKGLFKKTSGQSQKYYKNNQ